MDERPWYILYFCVSSLHYLAQCKFLDVAVKTFTENWVSKQSLDIDNGLKLFFRNKTCLFFKIDSWNFKHLFEKDFCETSQNFNSFSSFRQFLFSFFLSVVWLSWNFVRFHVILFQTDAEIFSFLSYKTKKVLFLKKIWFRP